MLLHSTAASLVRAILISVILSSTARAIDAGSYVPNGEFNRATAFVDFHARPGPDLVGHSFIVYGRLDAYGRAVEADVAGLYTKEQFYPIGLFIPLRGFVGAEKEDWTVKSAVVYRRYLTLRQLSELKAAIWRVRASKPAWHLLFLNCNDFVGEMANAIGLRRPPSLILPVIYVSMLRAMNGPDDGAGTCNGMCGAR